MNLLEVRCVLAAEKSGAGERKLIYNGVGVFNQHKSPSTEQYNKSVKQNPVIETIMDKDMGKNRGLNTQHVIDGIGISCDDKTRQNKWKMKSGSAMARRSVTSTAERLMNKERDLLRWKS